MLRPGGTVSGPTLMALADFAMYVVLLSAIGPIGLAATVNLTINFLRKGLPGQDVLAAARLLKVGKRLAVGEVSLLSDVPRSDRACHLHLFHSTYLVFRVVSSHHYCKSLRLLAESAASGIDVGRALI
jgi:hypothetical protein